MACPVTQRFDLLTVALLAYAAASLAHHAHNAAFLVEYPNMPGWLSPPRVYAAWLGVTSVGLTGFLLVERGHRRAGLVALIAYAALGFLGLGHYRLAPVAAHTLTMNVTIWLEVLTAALLLAAAVQRLRDRPPP